MTAASVLYSSRDGVAEIRFSRPDRLNVIDLATATAFARAVDQALGDASNRVIVIAAEGRAFVAGGDLGYFREASNRRNASADLIAPMHGALERLGAASQITIGSLKGAVAGGGMSLALGLDLLVAADDTLFNLAYGRIGASPDCGGSWALPRLVGFRKALEIALLSDSIGAEEALRLGLVNRVVPLDDLERETGKMALRLANGPSLAYGRIKSLMRRSLGDSYRDHLALEAQNFADCSMTEDFAEALDAFFEKRKPVFSGR